MNERDYEHLAHYLDHPPQTVIADWEEFVRPLPEAPEPRPVWEGAPARSVDGWVTDHVGHVQRLVIAMIAASRWLPAWEAYAAHGFSEAHQLAPRQGLWLLDRWLRGDEDQRTRVIRDIQRQHELCVEIDETFEPIPPDLPAARAVAAVRWLSSPSYLCTGHESFPFCFGSRKASEVLVALFWWPTIKDPEVELDRWWRRVCATLAFVDGLSAELE